MFFRLGRGVVRHPWLVIGIWIVAAVAIVGLAPKLATSSRIPLTFHNASLAPSISTSH